MRGAAALALGVAFVLVGGGARASETATCDIPIVHALPGGGAAQIDPRLDSLKAYLSKPPFTAWHNFRLIDHQTLTLQEGGSGSFTLPNNRPATLTFVGHSIGAKEHRIRLRLVIEHPEKQHRVLDTTFVLDEGGVVLNVGHRYDSGVLILAVSCKTQN
jgi:hypothetical protein